MAEGLVTIYGQILHQSTKKSVMIMMMIVLSGNVCINSLLGYCIVIFL